MTKPPVNRASVLATVEELAGILDEPGLVILDCRFELGDASAGRREYVQGHIPGAVYADLDEDLSAPVTVTTGRHPLPRPRAAAKRFAELGVSRESDVIVYDAANAAIASRAWWMLRWLGHERVRLLDGGYAAWRGQGLATEPGLRQPEKGDFVAVPNPDLVVSADAIVAADLETEFLLDARDSERFEGIREPIDSRAGHIPGAKNAPFAQTLDASGRIQPTERLRSQWVEWLDGDLRRDSIAMCGSGVTACHLVASALIVGAPEPRLYAGSWSEWIRDPSRPVEVQSGTD